MWIFDKAIATLRKSYKFRVKIETHEKSDISGRHVCHVQKDEYPLTHPLPRLIPPKVLVEYTARGVNCTESIDVRCLQTTRLVTKGKHAVIRGDRVGQIVIHKKTEAPLAQVYVEGTDRSKDAFRIDTSFLCVIE